jgi:hypothetical protein
MFPARRRLCCATSDTHRSSLLPVGFVRMIDARRTEPATRPQWRSSHGVVCIPGRVARDLPGASVFGPAARVCARAGLFRFRRAYTARCGAEFFRRLCPADGDLRPAVCLGRKRRFLAGDHQLLFVWTGSVFPLSPASSDARVPRPRLAPQPIRYGTPVHCTTARQRSTSPPACVRSDGIRTRWSDRR